MSMDASSRAPAPPPLQLGPVRAATAPCSGTTPRSADSMTNSHAYSYSGDSSHHQQHYYYSSPTSTTYSTSASSDFSWTTRKDSISSSTSNPASGARQRPAALQPSVAARKVNANSYCGRHSDEFLFGGKGLGDLWRAVTKK